MKFCVFWYLSLFKKKNVKVIFSSSAQRRFWMSLLVVIACKLLIFCNVFVKILLFIFHKYCNLLPLPLSIERGKDFYKGYGYIVRSKEEFECCHCIDSNFSYSKVKTHSVHINTFKKWLIIIFKQYGLLFHHPWVCTAQTLSALYPNAQYVFWMYFECIFEIHKQSVFSSHN